MKKALQYIVSSIVDNPKDAKIAEQKQDEMTQLIITVNPEDMGKIIGKEGKVIRSIRNVMKILAMKHNEKINISLSETPQ
ncbi:MAG: KH domain-containing protein [Candidatus Levyibacteriota bacterium]|nr:MAG: KH domain-containing protein [Candidatus Levybacteria bacterium]